MENNKQIYLRSDELSNRLLKSYWIIKKKSTIDPMNYETDFLHLIENNKQMCNTCDELSNRLLKS